MSDEKLNDVYRQRNNLAIAFCKAALAAGWPAGRGIDDMKVNSGDADWANVLYVDLPDGNQVSWHIAPSAVHLLEGIPQYKNVWVGTFTARDKNWPDLIPIKVVLPKPIVVFASSAGYCAAGNPLAPNGCMCKPGHRAGCQHWITDHRGDER